MEIWVFFSILTALSWAMSNIIDKFILTKKISDTNIPLMLNGIVGLMSAFIVYLVQGISEISFFLNIIALTAGVFSIGVTAYYLKATKIEEISRVTSLYYIYPFFTAVLAAFFLAEIFDKSKYLGIISLVIGAALVSTKNISELHFSKAVKYMLLAALFGALNAVSTKYVLNFTDFWTVFIYLRMGSFIGLMPTFYSKGNILTNMLKRGELKTLLLVCSNTGVYLLGAIFFILAMSSGYVTLVNSITAMHPFFVLIFGIVVTKLFPKSIKEEITKKIVIQKLFAIILIFLGVLLIV